MIAVIIILSFVLYALIAYIRRKIVKPNYTGKTVWITGASSGIGQYLAYAFSKAGAKIIISARDQKQLQRVKGACQFPDLVKVVKMDMCKYDEVKTITADLIASLEKNDEKLDVVVENAGRSMRCEFRDYAFENHVGLFDLNVHGPYNHIQCFIEHMIKNKSGQIVGVTSLAGKLSTAFRSSYAGSKHAFIGILDSLRTQFKPYGIQVCNIMPGYIRTNLSKNAFASGAGQKFGVTDSNIETGMDPERFANEAIGSIYNRENQVSIGDQWLPLFGLILRNLCPDLTFLMLAKNSKNQSKAIAEGKMKAQ